MPPPLHTNKHDTRNMEPQENDALELGVGGGFPVQTHNGDNTNTSTHTHLHVGDEEGLEQHVQRVHVL